MSLQGVVPAGIVHRLLDNENYLDWSVWVKTYLMGENLWDIVESMDEPPKPEDGDKFKYWRSKNASALHVIQMSCNGDAFSEIRNITSAKEAWDILEVKFKPQPESTDKIISDDEVNNPDDQYQLYERFPKALKDGNLDATKEIITQYPNAVSKIISRTGRTALYVAAIAGHTEIVETLVEKMLPEDLEMKDSNGITALTVALYYNANTKIVECMVKKSKKLPTVVDSWGMPVIWAFRYCPIKMARYLYSVTTIEDLISWENHGYAAELISQAIITKCYDVALHLLHRCPQLATTLGIYQYTPVHILAIYSSGRPLKFWQKWINESIVIYGDRVIKEIYTKLPTNIDMSSDKELRGKVWSLQRVAMHFDILGAALQMQRELQWFKAVESVVPPWTCGWTNSKFLTPRQLFTREHKQLLSEGEKWMKETATSCTVVGALIVTIMFAATFTVPGGNDEETGYPKFLDDKTFMLFIISDAISLFSSTTSVLMFLGILTSTYAEDDFLKSLPKKLMIGLGTLFLSIAAMMISFCAAVCLMLDGKKSWVALFIISLASIPVTLFVLMQFPLLIEIYLSTYRPNIFNRKP